MALRFSLRRFFRPLALLRMRRLFARGARFDRAAWEAFQAERLKEQLARAARAVPWWRMRFAECGFSPDSFTSLADLARLPLLTRDEVARAGLALRSAEWRRLGAHPVATGGTTGRRLTLWMDRDADAQEFCYYWRLWNDAGYRLGDPLAEFSAAAFRGRETETFRFEPLTRRLLLNGAWVDGPRAVAQAREMRRRGCRFLKGLPSQLAPFADLLAERGESLPMKALFSQGEALVPRDRRRLEAFFGCRAVDSWGHMERTAALSGCPAGRLHLVPDYGMLEFLPADAADVPPSEGLRRVRLVGSSLHNRAMPLFRYDTGDLAEVRERPEPCPCGRPTPTVERVLGRASRVVTAPDGRRVSVLFLVLEEFGTLLAGRIEEIEGGRLPVAVVPGPGFTAAEAARLRRRVEALVGPSLPVELRVVPRLDDLRAPSGKIG